MEKTLKPLGRCIAFCGLTLSSNVFNASEKSEKSLCRQPLFWWCLFVSLLQLFHLVFTVVIQRFTFQSEVTNNLPLAVLVTAFAMVGLYLVLNLVSRLPFLHGKQISSTIEKLTRFDKLVEEHHEIVSRFTTVFPRKLRKAMLIGIFWIIITLLLSIPTFTNFAQVEWSYFYIVVGLAQVIGYVHVVLVLTLFYSGNLAIALRLKILNRLFQKLVPVYINYCDKVTDKRKIFVLPASVLNTRLDTLLFRKQMDEIKHSFYVLKEASDDFNAAYAVTVLIFLACKIFMCSISMYGTVFPIIAQHGLAFYMVSFSASLLVSDLVFFLVILLSADQPVNEWKCLLTQVSHCRTADLTEEQKAEVITFLQQIKRTSFALSAAGMFNVGKHLIPGISATVLTYIIVMLQSSTTTNGQSVTA